MAGPLFIDDIDLDVTLGWKVMRDTLAGFDGAPAAVPATMRIPGLGNQVVSSRNYEAPPRRLTATLYRKETVKATMETAGHRLRALVEGRVVRLRHDLRTNQEILARCVSFPMAYGVGPKYLPPYVWKPTLEFEADDPYFRDTTDQTVNFTTTATAVPVGTKRCKGRYTIVASGGTVTNPILTWENSAGTTIATIQPTIAILNGDAFEIDHEAGTVRKRVSGVWSNARNTIPIGTVIPFLDPAYGDFATSAWQKIKCSAGNGSVVYRRRWA